MKKINILLGAFLLTCSMGYSQTKKTEKADELFDTYQYISAIDKYMELVEDGEATAYVYKQLGDSYYKIFNTAEAEKWYAKAVMNDQDAETYYRYAQVLKSQGEYEKANAQMDVFSRKRPEDSRAKAHLQNPNYIPSLADKEENFTVSPVEFSSSEYSDFGPVVTNTN
ncbi:tetratricopeptide repeat protein [Mesonia aquimarina]|uniref:tetratricopeptide repeat protein n=1 Tax=Mesonia aquimarina TaxID=1504967 RepID=UPI000EF62295|nr:tetratricopeptide repeat protein [Mesonia aquimarina]